MGKQQFQIQFDFQANMSQVKNSVAELQKTLGGINLPPNLSANFQKLFGKLNSEMTSFEALTKNGFSNMADVNKAQTAFGKVAKLINEINIEAGRVKGIDPNKLIPQSAQQRVEGVTRKLEELQAQQNKKDGFSEQIKKQTELLNKQKKDLDDLRSKRTALQTDSTSLKGQKSAAVKRRDSAKSDYDAAVKRRDSLSADPNSKEYAAASKDVERYGRALQTAQSHLDQVSNKLSTNSSNLAKNKANIEIAERSFNDLKAKLAELNEVQVDPQKLTALRQELASLTGTDIKNIPTDLNQIQAMINGINSGELAQVSSNLDVMEANLRDVEGATQGAQQGMRQFVDSAADTARANSGLDQLKTRMQYFFGMTNSIQLFKRAVRSAINTVKELDATMTEAAVVTDFSVGDMWDKLPIYSEEARKLGVSINSMYQATTLYYQQGLKTNEAMALGVETMKMAKIAGMESAEATEAMTAALRGFNMELNETSAIKVNDVYSQLAAITAADTEQIATAMEKTASIAASANMEFETTAALLAQIIETTQEAPETAGTAMKTIIARFAEVKSLRDQGLSSGEDEEGEGIDVNKIQTALRSVGISMEGFFSGTEGLDSILLKLAEKWSTLDFETQRYIATMAAGSRQQSRFIAMMSDYSRTTELVTSAQNSAGASQRQFEKTMESLEYKLTNLSNAWQTFLMNLSNNDLIKLGVDLLTDILNIINDITNAISGGNGLIKSITSLGVAIGGLQLGKIALNRGLAAVGGAMGIGGAQAQKTGILKGTWGFVSGKTASQKQTGAVADTFKTRESRLSKKWDKNFNKYDKADKAQDYKAMDKYEKKIQDVEAKQASLNAEQEKYVAQSAKVAQGARIAGTALTGVGTAVLLVTNLLYENNIITKEQAEWWNKFGTVLTIVGIALTVLTPIFQGFSNMLIAKGVAVQAAWWPLLVLFLVIGGLVGLFLVLSSSSDELTESLKAQQEATQRATEAAEEAATAYNEFRSSLEKLDEIEDKFDGLISGTEEWKDAIRENNEEVMKLVENYDGLAEHVSFDKDGKLVIDPKALEKAEKELERTKIRTASAVQISKAKEKGIEQKMILEPFNVAEKRLIQDLARDSSLLVDKTRLQAYGFTMDEITDEMKAAAEELALSQVGQMENIRLSIQQGISTETAQSDFANQAVQAISENLTNQNMDDMVNTKRDELITKETKDTYSKSQELKDLFKEQGVATTGDDLKDMQNLYMKMTGKQSVEEIDEDIRDSVDSLALAISEMKLSEDFTTATEKLIKSLDKLPNDMSQAILIGMGQGVTDATTIGGVKEFLGTTYEEYLAASGLTKDEYAKMKTGEENRVVYGRDVSESATFNNITPEQARILAEEMHNDGLMSDLDYYAFLTGMSSTATQDEMIETLLDVVGMRSTGYGFDRNSNSVRMGEGGATYYLKDTKSVGETGQLAYEAEQAETQKIWNELKAKYEKAFANNPLTFDDLFANEFDVGTIKKVINSMESVFTQNPQAWSDIINRMKKTSTYIEDLKYLQTIDWANEAEALEAMEYMREKGYSDDIITDYWKAATDSIDAYTDGINGTLALLNKLRNETKKDSELIEKLYDGTASDADVKELVDAGLADWSDFRATAEGWKMVNGSIEEAVTGIKKFRKESIQAMIDAKKAALKTAQALASTRALSPYATVKTELVSQDETGKYKVNEDLVRMSPASIARKLNPSLTAEEARNLSVEEVMKMAQEQADILNNAQTEIDILQATLDTLNENDGALDTNWNSSLDKSYNLYQKINVELEKRERLEREYERLLENEDVTGKKVYKNLKARIDSLDDTISYQGQVETAKNYEIQTFRNENSRFNDYYTYDADTGKIWLLIDPDTKFKSSPETGKAFEEFIGELESRVKQRNEARVEKETAQDEKDSSIKELREGLKEFQNTIKDTIVAERQEEIDKLSAINDSINDTNSKILNSMQEQLDASRQARDNEKTEQELEDKQQRLIYLQQDTSGANATEILQLQKEIEEGQESYTDKLIDQKISALQKQNDKAAEQRQHQIEIMTAQLEADQNNGTIWSKASEMISEGMTKSGTIKAGSELDNLIRGSEEFKALSPLEQEAYMQEMAAGIAQWYAFSKLFPDMKFATGGLADFTGPAWLDGTKSRPEYVLNANQTQAFFNLVDVLESLHNGTAQTAQNNGDNTYDIDINVESIGSDYDVERLADKVKTMIVNAANYRNNNTL